MKLSGCKNLKELPDLSKATNLKELELNNCTSLVTLPSSIQNLDKLERLCMGGCTSLEVLPTNINLVALLCLYLSGCSRLNSFPQLSTNIVELYLDDTAIEEVPSWIENIAGLTRLWMTGCEKLRKVTATMWNLKHLDDVGFEASGSDMVVSNASLVKTLTELHQESTENYTEELVCGSRATSEYLLARGAQEYTLQTDFCFAVLLGKQVPKYFMHRTRGPSLSVSLPQSSLSQKKVGFTSCIILDLATDFQYDHITIFAHWKFRGVTGLCRIKPVTYYRKMDSLVVFHFDIDTGEEVDDPPSHFDCNCVKFEFEVHKKLPYCVCYRILGTQERDLETCPIFPQNIKGCGIRVLSVSPSLDASSRSSETEYNLQDGESDADSERSSETEDDQQSREVMRSSVIKHTHQSREEIDA